MLSLFGQFQSSSSSSVIFSFICYLSSSADCKSRCRIMHSQTIQSGYISYSLVQCSQVVYDACLPLGLGLVLGWRRTQLLELFSFSFLLRVCEQLRVIVSLSRVSACLILSDNTTEASFVTSWEWENLSALFPCGVRDGIKSYLSSQVASMFDILFDVYYARFAVLFCSYDSLYCYSYNLCWVMHLIVSPSIRGLVFLIPE